MIISASRRTDIPAFYSEWFFNRLREGFVYVRNPFNRKQVGKIRLTPELVDCFIFWTKDPLPMMKRLDELKEYNYYFQFTLTSYRKDVETNLRKKNDILKTFKQLSDMIGKERVIWRYDPIFLNPYYTKEYHYEWFERLAEELEGYTERCVISFLDLYKKTERNIKALEIISLTTEDIYEIAERFSSIVRDKNIAIKTCSEAIDLTKYGIEKGKCIDDRIISRIMNCPIDVKKDDTQREVCGCVKSIDIGEYNSCQHNCLYCYANFNYKQVKENSQKHLVNSPILIGNLVGDEKIAEREMKSIRASGQQVIQYFF